MGGIDEASQKRFVGIDEVSQKRFVGIDEFLRRIYVLQGSESYRTSHRCGDSG